MARRNADDDVSRLEAHVHPLLGKRAVTSVTLEDCEAVMRWLSAERKGKKPKKPLSAATLRNVALTLSRLFSLAVYPLRLISR
ncbi:MAG TPA: hypothetical protein VG937_04355 [Polyangiaceae bacterium]|jgi:hypothetical protein|nr:hypothetical protein [Polyangiaceae bacterium]